MGDGLQGDAVDARQTGGDARGQARQLPAIALGQVSPGGADLLGDQVGIVQQPLPGRGDALLGRNRRGQQVAGLDQHSLVGGKARQQPLRHPSRRQPVGGGQAQAVLLHLIGAEQLGPQRRLYGEPLTRATLPAQARPDSDPAAGQACAGPSATGPWGRLPSSLVPRCAPIGSASARCRATMLKSPRYADLFSPVRPVTAEGAADLSNRFARTPDTFAHLPSSPGSTRAWRVWRPPGGHCRRMHMHIKFNLAMRNRRLWSSLG